MVVRFVKTYFQKIISAGLRYLMRFSLLISVFLVSGLNLWGQTTLYSYQTGDWNSNDTWTTDPSGTILQGSGVPTSGDTVIILSSRTVTLSSDIATTNLDITINSGGILEQGIYRFTNTLAALRGQGILQLGTMNFPAVTTNTFVDAGGGTTDYYGFTGTITQTEYNHLKIQKKDNNASSYIVALGSNVTINGDFEINRMQGSGTITVTVGNSMAVRNIAIAGNLTISTGALLNVGNFNAIHTISLGGDMINNGSVDLSNSAQYAAATTGAAVFTFTGETDNSLMCNGTTDFYRFILNKGSDRTYILTVTSANAAYFRLFGPVSATGGDWSTLPLILQNGTLKLRSAVNIPVLGKNTGAGAIAEFHIPGSAGLWIDGATVSTSDDGGGWRGITIYGLFRISSGSFTNPNNTGGITYFGNVGQPGYILIEGGTVNTTQVKQADVNGRVTYHQTGGSLRITGYSDSRGSSAVFALPTADFNYIMSGGSVYISGINTTATNGIDIQVSASNYNVTGGTFTIVRPSAVDDQTNFEISSTAPFYNLTLKDTSSAGANNGFQILNDLVVLNNLTVTNRTLDANNNDVTVGGNFTVSAGATYTPGTNTTTFNGTGNQTFLFNGTVTSGFNNLVINNTGATVSFSRTTPTSLDVRGTFDLTSGTLNDGGNTINIYGNVTNSGTHTGTGSIVLLDNDPQTIGGDGNGVFQNLTLNNSDGLAAPVSLTAGIRVNGTLSLASNKIFYINSYNLILGPSATISGTFSATRFIQTNGDVGDKGLTKYFSANSFTYPLGVGTRYTPSTIAFSATPSTYGSVTVFPVDAEQMQTSANGKQRSLTYFWRIRSADFTLGSATITQTFRYDESDVSLLAGATEADYVPARYNPTTYNWFTGTTANINTTTNLISWPNGVNYIDGDYTAGDNTPAPQNPFGTVTVLYSYQSGPWTGNNTWMTDTNNVATITNTNPDRNTPVMIRNGHTVTVDGNNSEAGNVQIQATGVLDCIAYTGLYFGVVTNPVNGSGKIRISIPSNNPNNERTAVFPSGDFSEFRGSDGGTVEYYTGAIDDMLIPATSASGDALTNYKHLILTPATGRYIALPNLNLTIYGDLTAQGIGSSYFNTAANSRTVAIGGDVNVTSGTLQYRNGAAQNITVAGDITVSSGATFSVQNSVALGHTLSLNGDLTNNGTVMMSTAGSDCNITFNGSISTSITGAATSTVFNNLTINKGTSQAITLTADVTGSFTTPTNNWLTIINGTFRFMRTGNLNVTTTSTFTIPTTAGLYINHPTAVIYLGNSNNDNNDVYLNGKLTIIDGTVYVGPSTAPGNNNDIEYSASGNSEIEIQGGSLIVNGQIRRSVSGTGGVLMYKQSGGSVAINGSNQSPARAKLEIENAGSEFTMSEGTITFLRGGGTTFGDLYLRPQLGSVTGGSIILQPVNNVTAGEETFVIDASLPLNNLIITGFDADDAARASLNVNPLVLNGSFTLSNSNSYFSANDINVTVKGDFTNNGTYTPGTNTTTFDGTTQTLGGTTATQFYNLYANPSTSLTLTNNITVNNTLTLNSGLFLTDTYDVNAKGNVINNAVHSGNSSAGGILLNGTVEQLISGPGTYGRIELNNTNGAKFLNNISLAQDLLLTNGVLDINQYLLSLGVNSNIVGSGFGSSKMIKPDGVLSNVGIRKSFGAGANTFTYPVGVTGKYTPALLTINNNSTPGSVRVNVINDNHPAVSDPNNVLQYYWEVESSGISAFEGNLVLSYSSADVMGAEADYVAARLIIPPGTDWSKASPGSSTDNVDEALNSISFNYPSGTSNLGGEYTAGNDAAIPDQVPVYTTNSDGDWDDVNIWTPAAPAGGPNGFIVIINAGDSVSTNGNRRFAYRTTINGVLDIGTSYGHNLGYVNGTGKLYLETATLPAGRLSGFLNCAGGTLEFGGSSSYTIVADRIDTVKNLYFTGSGTKTLPNKDLVICNLLKIDGPALDNSVYNRKLTLLGAVQRLNTGTFVSGTGANATVAFKGISAQQVGGSAGNFSGSNALNNLELDNSYGLTLNGTLELKRNLLLTDGVITTTSANLLSMINWNTSVIPAGGSASSYVSGPMTKRIFTGDDFGFPVGKGTRYGKLVLMDVSKDDDWMAEYFNTGYSSLAVTSPLIAVSSTEYWHLTGPAGEQAYVKLRWDAQSDITPLTAQNGISDIRVAEYGATSWEEQLTSASGTDYDGTAETTNIMNLDEHDYTLGSVSTLKPRASFTDTDDACTGDDLFVAFTNTAGSYTFTYNINGGSNLAVTTSDNPYTLNTASAGRYRLTTYTGGVVDTNSVFVNPIPTATLTSSDADDIICEGESVTFTAGGGITYNFFVNGSSVQNSGLNTYMTAILNDDDEVYVEAMNAQGCTNASSTITMTVQPIPATGPLYRNPNN